MSKMKTTAVSPRKHHVSAVLRNVELVKAKSSLNLSIYADNQKIGELEIGRGSVYWWGKSRQRSKRIGWTRFAAMMDELAYGG